MNFKEHKKDIIAISALLIIVTTITLLLLNIDGKAGVYYVRDVYFYLNNALFYAGYDIGMTDTRGLSPLIPMITSIFFRMGFVSDFTILAVSASFYIFASLGMYFLLRLRFNEELSFTGSMVLSTFPLIFVWIGKGMLDIPALCFSIWSVFFMILSFKKNPKFLYVAAPLVILGFFSRFTVLLMVPVLAIQFFLVDEPIKYIKDNLKHIIIGILSGTIVLVIFLGIYSYLDIGMFFLSQGGDITQSTHSVINLEYNNIFYYIKNFPIYLGTGTFLPYSLKPGTFLINEFRWIGGYPTINSYILMAVMLVGSILYLMKLFSKKNRQLLKEDNKKYIKLTIFILGLIFFVLTFIKISIIFSIIILSISLLALYRWLNKAEMDHFDFDFIMIYWFVVNLSFFTYYHIKVDRYFIPMLPFFAYLFTLSLELIFDKLKSVRHIEKIKVVTPIAIVCFLLLCTGVYSLTSSPHTYDNQMHPNFFTAASEEKAVGDWLIKHDPEYMNKTVWADRGGDFTFLLKSRVPSMEKISEQNNFTDRMIKENVTYFIAKDNKTIGEPYVKLYQNGEVSLYYNSNENN